MKKRLTQLATLFLFTACTYPASAGTVSIPLIQSLFETDGLVTVENNRVSFQVDKKATVLIKLRGVAEIHFDYEAEGYFRLSYLTATPPVYKIDPKFLIGYPLSKSDGRLKLNLRHTLNWSAETYPVLMLEGTGKFTIKNMKAVTVSALSDYRSEKNSAFFWRPETLRSSLMNFITPVYWDFSKKILWMKILGTMFIISVFVLSVFCFVRKENVMKYLPNVSLFFALIFSLHFAVRFVPIVHGRFYLSNEDKILRYYPLPELAQLLLAAKKEIKPNDKVAIWSDEGAWFARKALYFNLAPTKVVFYRQWYNTWHGLNWYPIIKTKDINVVIHYNSEHELDDPGALIWSTVYQLNENVFIKRKR